MDLIDRQAAIMGLIFSDGTKDLTCGQMAKILYVIQALPSAQPEPEEDCDTCKHGYFGDRQCDNCRVRYPSHYEREEEHHGSD